MGDVLFFGIIGVIILFIGGYFLDEALGLSIVFFVLGVGLIILAGLFIDKKVKDFYQERIPTLNAQIDLYNLEQLEQEQVLLQKRIEEALIMKGDN